MVILVKVYQDGFAFILSLVVSKVYGISLLVILLDRPSKYDRSRQPVIQFVNNSGGSEGEVNNIQDNVVINVRREVRVAPDVEASDIAMPLSIPKKH